MAQGPDWQQAVSHKLDGTSVVLKKDAQSGFGLYAKTDIIEGETVLSERPSIMVACEATKTRTCALCFYQAEDDLSLECACGQQWFCSEICQELFATSGLHSADECRSLAADGFEQLSADTKDIVRVGLRLLTSGVATVNTNLCTVRALKSGGEDAITRTISEAISFVTRHVRMAAPAKAALSEALLRASCNQTGLYGPGWQEIALIVFKDHLHIFNHSCFPNVCFDHWANAPRQPLSQRVEAADAAKDLYTPGAHGPPLSMKCVRKISAGEQVVQSYVHTRQSVNLRLTALEHAYKFHCGCPRCTDDAMCEDDDMLFDYMCPEYGCSLIIPDGDHRRCVLCGADASGGQEEDND